jgi:hypothetical protein
MQARGVVLLDQVAVTRGLFQDALRLSCQLEIALLAIFIQIVWHSLARFSCRRLGFLG